MCDLLKVAVTHLLNVAAINMLLLDASLELPRTVFYIVLSEMIFL